MSITSVLNAARKAQLRVLYAMHHRYCPGDLQLKKHGIHQLIVIGLIAHTCIEATVRYAAELGYDVTVVKDATADYTDEMMHAALDINIPNYASAVVGTEEIVALLSAL